MRSKIKDVPGFERNGKAVVATDMNELEAYKKRRAKIAEDQAMREDINMIKSRLSNIEQLLQRIVDVTVSNS